MKPSLSRYAYLDPYWNSIEEQLNPVLKQVSDIFLPNALEPLKEVFYRHAFLWSHRCCDKDGTLSLDRYPVAERILLRWKHDFTAYVADFLRDSATAFPNTASLLPPGSAGRMIRVSGNISDIHNGRFVMALETENGGKLFYKPTLQNTDKPWITLLGALADDAGLTRFVTPKRILAKNGSFIEFIRHLPVEDEKGVASYFRKCGFMLGAACLTGASDLHAENLVAFGDCPVIIDSETICAAVWPQIALPSVNTPCGHSYDNVLSTALLPFLVPGKTICHGSAAFIDCLPNTHNLPYTEDSLTNTRHYYSGRQYSGEIQKGFLRACKSICHLNASGALAEILKQFNSCHYRCLLRGTAYYDILLRVLAAPDLLESETHFDNHVRSLLKMKSHYGYTPGLHGSPLIIRLKSQELCAVKNGYIPLITDDSGQYDSHWLPAHIISRRAALFTQSFIACQRRIIAAILPDRFVYDHSRPSSKHFTPRGLHGISQSLWPFLGETMPHVCRCLTCGPLTGYVSERQEGRIYLAPLTLHMTETLLGYALAAGAWYALTKEEKVLTALRLFAEKLETEVHQASMDALGEGMAEGIGGFLRALTILSALTGIPEFEQLEEKAADAILSRNHPLLNFPGAGDYSFFYSESASMLALSLMAPEKLTLRHIEKITFFAKSICTQLLQMPELLQDSRDFSNPLPSTLGTAAAVMAVSHLLPDSHQCQCRLLWESALSVWEADIKAGPPAAFYICQLMAGEIPSLPVSLQLVKNESFTYGNAGLMEILIETSVRCREPDLTCPAQELAALMLHGMADSSPAFDAFPFPSFFHGDGGILYTLMRFLDPQKVPSLLIPPATADTEHILDYRKGENIR